MPSKRNIQEVYPTFGPAHMLGPEHAYPVTLMCWCKPRLLTACEQCDGEVGCWQCGGTGTVEVEHDDGFCPLIVVHNSEDMLS